MKKLITICLVVLFAVNTYPVHATIMATPLGTNAPPSTLAEYTMTAFGADSRLEYESVTSVASPLGGTVDFSIQIKHFVVGSTWATWSHGYTGDVYWTNYVTSVQLTLPSDTVAFYFYAEPENFGIYTINANIFNGVSVTQEVDGNGGACGYAFWAHGGDLISSINISCPDGAGFAIGEFGIARVPEPTTICLLLLGAVSLIRTKK